MPRKAKDITGLVYGNLTAVRDTGKRTYGHVWLFKCSCGVSHEAVKQEVTGGKLKSCGCAANSGRFKKTHGDTNSPTYVSWRSMLDRCYRDTAENYPLYGGRGIEVCDSWKSEYFNFLQDMGARPNGKTLDRIDSSGNYEPSNCRWATPKEQANNTRKTRLITYLGETKSVTEWANDTGLSRNIIHCRLKAEWSIEDTLTTPRYKHRSKE